MKRARSVLVLVLLTVMVLAAGCEVPDRYTKACKETFGETSGTLDQEGNIYKCELEAYRIDRTWKLLGEVERVWCKCVDRPDPESLDCVWDRYNIYSMALCHDYNDRVSEEVGGG